MQPHSRPPSGKLFRTDCRFAPSLRNAPASCFRWLPVPAAPPRRPGQLLSPAARTSSSATAPRPAAFASCPYQQLRYSAPASCFRRLPVPAAPPRHPGQLLSPADRTSSSATAPRPAASAGCPYQQLHHGTPASNKPHPAEKSTPGWLAIWRTWAGFANSQLQRANFHSTY